MHAASLTKGYGGNPPSGRSVSPPRTGPFFVPARRSPSIKAAALPVMVRDMSNDFPPPQQNPQVTPQGHPQPGPPNNPQPGLPTYPGPSQDPAYAYGPMAPQRMPGSVRAARIVLWVLAGLVIIGSIGIAATGDSETAGAAVGVNFLLMVAAGLAFRFPKGGGGLRVACIVLMALHALSALAGAAGGNPGGLVPLLGAIAVIILLAQGTAGAWFNRPRP